MPTRLPRRTRGALAMLLAALTAAPASAAEVQFEGFYRGRARLFDSLSIDKDVTGAEGLAAYGQHRLWLRPRFILSDQLGVFTEIKALDNVVWGTEAVQMTDPVTGDTVALAFTDQLSAPATPEDGDDPGAVDIQVWRAWGEVHTGIGKFTVGRVPLHWGSGIWLNDGLGLYGEYGDTADRVSWEYEISDVFVKAAIDVVAEGLVQDSDDAMSYNLAAAYRAERVNAGLLLQLRHVPTPLDDGKNLNVFTIDGSTDAMLGPITLRVEAIGHFGGGDLSEAVNGASITAMGAVVDVAFDNPTLSVGLEGGLATGDNDITDEKVKTFSFDRDYNVALMMFERPMPVVTDGTGARTTDATLTGGAVSNAMYLRPRVSRDLIEDELEVEAALIAARAAKLPGTGEFADRSSYGLEIDAAVRYQGIQHLELEAAGGLFLPGSYYSNYSSDDYPDGFSGTVVGGQLTGRIRF